MPTLTDEQVVKQRNSLEFLRRPHLWGCTPAGHPVVMVRRRDLTGKFTKTGPLVMYWANDFRIDVHDWTDGLIKSVETFESADEVDAAGWEVD